MLIMQVTECNMEYVRGERLHVRLVCMQEYLCTRFTCTIFQSYKSNTEIT